MLAGRRDSRCVYTCNLGEEGCSDIRNPCLTLTEIAMIKTLYAGSFNQFTLKLVVGAVLPLCGISRNMCGVWLSDVAITLHTIPSPHFFRRIIYNIELKT